MVERQKSRATLTLSLEGNGKRAGHIALPWSRNESGWGSLRIPIGVVANGDGPSVLVTGGNHGDEYEGPLVISEFFHRIDPSEIRGRIICLPALNYPAVKAGRRLSPIDGGNMNRAFRNQRDGTITEQIAHFVEQEIVQGVDAVLDFHAGGRTMMFHPFAVSHRLPDSAQTERAKQALQAFGAPIGLVLEELDSEGMLDSAVESRGKLFLSTELGGGGSTTPETIRLARDGLHNFLVHLGALRADLRMPHIATRLMTNDADGYVVGERAGLIEYLVDLGAPVSCGDILARIYDLDDFGAEPFAVHAPANGLLIGRLHGGSADRGDFLALIAREL